MNSSHFQQTLMDISLVMKAYLNPSIQSPEVTSKATPSDQEINDNVKALTEKLMAALLNIRAKEDLVQQHAKVAEEAVSGWEKAENEMLVLKLQLEAVTQKFLSVEDRASHLDGALKECLRQLRLAREEQEQKIHEVVVKKSFEWESTKSELQNQVNELQSQLQAAKGDALTSFDTDIRRKLEAVEKENSSLKLELVSKAEELEYRTIERDLSTQAAETASKQHLDNIKKVARLEAECRRLKAVSSKASPTNNHRSGTASSPYVEFFTDCQSDSGDRLLVVENDTHKMSALELNEYEPSLADSWATVIISEQDQFTDIKALGRNFMAPKIDISLMDDFLEMERLAALPGAESVSYPNSGPVPYQSQGVHNPLRAELEILGNRTAELEEKLGKMETEKADLETALTELQDQLLTSRDCLEEAELKLVELQTQLSMENEARRWAESEVEDTTAMLKTSRDQLEEAGLKLVELQTQLAMTKEAGRVAEIEAKDANKSLKSSRDQLEEADLKLVVLQTQLAKESQARGAVEMELKATNLKKEVAESRLEVAETKLKTLLSNVSSLEEVAQKERAFSAETVAKCWKLEDKISTLQCETELRKVATSNGELKKKQDKELAMAASKFAECQKIIASIGQQLKSLATLEDFVNDSEKPWGICAGAPWCPEDGTESFSLHNELSLSRGNSEASTIVGDCSSSLKNGTDGDLPQRREIAFG